MGFKIADAYVVVSPKDEAFEVGLRRIVDEAAARVEAQVGLGLTPDAPQELRGDVDAALALVTDGLDANVGLGLHNDAVEQLDADVKAGVELVGENNKVKVKVDPKAAQESFAGLSPLLLSAFAGAATAGPALVLGATAAAVLGAGALITKNNTDLTASYTKLATDASNAVTEGTAPLVPAINQALQILDQGIDRAQPQLKNLFAAAAPQATAFASGISDLVNGALPGMVTGLRDAAPYAHDLTDTLGKLGTGVGELFAGLGTGAKGGAQGLEAVATVAEHLLGDVGEITGALSNGLGPALSDIGHVVVPVVDEAAKFTSELNPKVIRGIADATAALFAAFKIATLTGAVAEGTTFLAFLKSAAVGEVALTGETGLLTTAMGGLTTVMETLAGPAGAVLATLPLLTTNTRQYGLVNADAAGKVVDASGVISHLADDFKKAGDGSKEAQDNIDAVVREIGNLKKSGADVTPSLQAMDQELARLSLEDPKAGAKEYAALLNDLGVSAKQGAATFPMYTAAISDYSSAVDTAADASDTLFYATYKGIDPAKQLLSTITDSQQKIAQQAAAAGIAADANLSYADDTAALNTRVSESVAEYTQATSAADGYKAATDALFNKYGSYSEAQATFTTDLANATGQITRGKDAIDLNSAAGAKNFTTLKQLADANEQVAETFIKQGGSAQDATAKLQAGATQIDSLAKKAGFSDTQIAQLNKDLYGVPTVKEITLKADTTPAHSALTHLLNDIDKASGTIQIYATAHNPGGGKALGANADGGDVQAGEYSLVGERGPEIVQFARSGVVIPNDQIRTVGSPGTTAKATVGGVTIHNLTIPIEMHGFADFTDPIAMDAAAYRMAINILNALTQVQRAQAGAHF